MRTVPTDVFLQQAALSQIGFDPRYPRAEALIFLPPNKHSRFWTLPASAARWPHFIMTLLACSGPAGPVAVWPRGGMWPGSPSPDAPKSILATLCAALGVPAELQGAIEFPADEVHRLVALLAVGLIGMHYDLHVLPASGSALLQLSHHDVVHVECPEAASIERFITGMTKAGFPLPTDLPDATFKRPAWMPRPASKG